MKNISNIRKIKSFDKYILANKQNMQGYEKYESKIMMHSLSDMDITNADIKPINEIRSIIEETTAERLKIPEFASTGYSPLVRNLPNIVTLVVLLFMVLGYNTKPIFNGNSKVLTIILSVFLLQVQLVPSVLSAKDKMIFYGGYHRHVGAIALITRSFLMYNNSGIDKIFIGNFGIWLVYYLTAIKNYNPDHESSHIGQWIIYAILNIHGDSLYNKSDTVIRKLGVFIATTLYAICLSATWSHGYFCEYMNWFRQNKWLTINNPIVKLGLAFEPIRAHLQAFGPIKIVKDKIILIENNFDINNNSERLLANQIWNKGKSELNLRRILPISCNAFEHPLKLIYVLVEMILMVIIPYTRTRKLTPGIICGIVLVIFDMLPVPITTHGTYLYTRFVLLMIVKSLIK